MKEHKMILECAVCRTRYLVPDTAIGPNGRTVRCANCKHSWHQEGASAAALIATAICSCMGLMGERPNRFEKFVKGMEYPPDKFARSIERSPAKVTQLYDIFIAIFCATVR